MTFPIIQGRFTIYDLHCLCNILVAKIPMIKVCNPFPFRKTVFCDVIDEAMLRDI